MTLDLKQLPLADSIPPAIARIYTTAKEVYSAQAVEQAVDQLAVRLTVALQDENPLFIALLPDSLVLTGMLMRRLVFPLEIYVLLTSGKNDVNLPDLNGRQVVVVVGSMSQTDLDKVMSLVPASNAENVRYVSMFAGSSQNRAADFVALACEAPGHLGSGLSHLGYGANLPGVYEYELE